MELGIFPMMYVRQNAYPCLRMQLEEKVESLSEGNRSLFLIADSIVLFTIIKCGKHQD